MVDHLAVSLVPCVAPELGDLRGAGRPDQGSHMHERVTGEDV